MKRTRLKKPVGRYHHGQLRESLLLAAERALTGPQSATFTIRQLAATVGVSHAAAYRHFTNRAELVAEVALRGYEALGAVLVAIRHDSPLKQLAAIAEASLFFAVTEPGRWQVMFARELKPFDQFPSLSAAALKTLGILQETVVACIAAGEVRGNDAQLTIAVWAAVHGYASLLMNDQLAGPFGVRGPERWMVAQVVDGLAKP